MTFTWWQLALLINVVAFWTLFAVMIGVNIVNRTLRPSAPTRSTPGMPPQPWEEKS